MRNTVGMRRARRGGIVKRRSIRFDAQTRNGKTDKDKERQWLTSRDPSNLVTGVLKLGVKDSGWERWERMGKRDENRIENGMHGSKDTTSAARRRATTDKTMTQTHAARRCPQPRCMRLYGVVHRTGSSLTT